MQNILKDNRLSERLNKYFDQNIKLSFVCESELITLTKDDVFYKFQNDQSNNALIALNDDQSIIEDKIVRQLCNKSINNFSSGEKHVFAWNDRQEVFCWGFNRFGQLGNGRQDQDFVYIEPELNAYLTEKKIIDIKCGCEHSLALTEGGDVYAWGWNKNGQIGNESKFQSIPFKVEGFNNEKVVQISCGCWSSIALTVNGCAFGWGFNNNSCLGFKVPKNIYVPQIIRVTDEHEIDVRMRKISCGKNHTLMLSNEGNIYAFGDNQWGQIGNGNEYNQWNPFKLNIHSKKFVDIALHIKYDISIAIADDGIYYIWGKYSNESIIRFPKETQFQSVNDVFIMLFGITYEPLEGRLCLNRNITFNGRYEKNYIEIEKFGEGSYGCVYKVKNKNNAMYAIKKLKFQTDNKNEFLKEFQISCGLKKLDANYCVEFYNAWFEEENIINNQHDKLKSELILHIVMELCDMTLEDIIDQFKSDPNLLENENLTEIGYYIASELFFEILEGVDHLHKQNPPLIHRDLKPENILIKRRKNGRFVRIADFGLVTMHEFAEKTHNIDKGTVKFMAPEVIFSENYDTKADIFSLGKIMENLFNIIDFDRNYVNDDKSALLMSNYQNVSSFCQKMTDDSIDIRPNCSEIIANKNLWYFNGENLNLNDLRIFFNSRKTYLHNILESKLMDSIGVRNYLTSIYNFKINNSALLSLSHLDVRMESIFDLHDEKLIDIANGWNHATALSQSGKVYTWERHSYGDVGEMIRNDYFKLELNEFLSEKCIIEIKCGCKHSLALTKSGEVYAWSPNGSINLGNDSQNNGKPVKINGFDEEKVKMISCGLHHSLALTENGHVYSWGANVFGQLGVHSKNHTFEYFDGFVVEHSGFELTPRKVNIPNVFIQKVSCGSGHSLLLSTEGDIYVFGNNDKVQLGNLLLRELSPPFKLNSSRKYSEIASHPFHSFSVALSENNNYYIWGKFGSKVYERPTKTDFSSLDKIYAKCFMRTKKFDQIMNYIF